MNPEPGQPPRGTPDPETSVRVREARDADIDAMRRIRAAVRENVLANPESIGPDLYRVHLHERSRGWVCELESEIVGFAIGDFRDASIWALFVDVHAEGRGVGRKLHETMLDAMFAAGLSRIELGTDPGTRAEAFYRKAGWEAAGLDAEGELRFQMKRERYDRARRS